MQDGPLQQYEAGDVTRFDLPRQHLPLTGSKSMDRQSTRSMHMRPHCSTVVPDWQRSRLLPSIAHFEKGPKNDGIPSNELLTPAEEVTESKQTPPFWHGEDSHSSKSTAQFSPPHPAVQLQLYVPTAIETSDVES